MTSMLIEPPEDYVKSKYLGEHRPDQKYFINFGADYFSVDNAIDNISRIFVIDGGIDVQFKGDILLFKNQEVVKVSNYGLASKNTMIDFLLPKIQKQVLKHGL